MTAYRSSNDYRQDLLRYDGTVVVNVTVTPAVIAGTSTAPAVTVTEGAGVTVAPAVIAATSTAPAVTVGEGTGVTVTPAVIATAATTPAVTVQINITVQASTVTGTAALPTATWRGIFGGASAKVDTDARTNRPPAASATTSRVQ